MDVYRRFRLDDGRLVERLVEVAPTAPIATFVVECDFSPEDYCRNYEPIAPQGNFNNWEPSKKSAEIKYGNDYCELTRQPWTSWKRYRNTPWRFNKKGRRDGPPFRLLASELAENETAWRDFLTELKLEVISSLDYW